MNDLTTTNVWLAVLAIVSVIEFLVLCVSGIFAYKLYRRAMIAIDSIERVHVAPVRARVDAVLDQVEELTGRVRHAQDSVGHVLQTAAGAGSLIAGTVKARSWPLMAVISGVRVAAATLLKNGSRHPRRVAST